jgi:hypothetical protein
MISATLAAFAATAAAAQGGEQVYFTIKLENARVAGIQGSPGGQIGVRSFEWGGTRGTTAYKRGFSGRGIDIAAVDGQPVSPGGSAARKDMVLKGSNVGQNSRDPGSYGNWIADVERPAARGTVGANQSVTVGGARTESRLPPQLPVMSSLTEGGTAAQAPLQKGSVWVRVSSPWSACRVGARYPSLELAGGGKTYVMRDVTVSSCGGSSGGVSPDEVAFSYQSIKFQY